MKSIMFPKFLITLAVVISLNNDFSCLPEDPKDDCTIGRDVITKRGELLVNGSTMWQLTVANENGAIKVADKNCHAKMQVEFWFKNKELAMTNAKPPISIVFFGGGGFFDPGSVTVYSKQITDNSYIWTAYCDQAAKNASENPTDFGVSVTWDFNQMLNLNDVVIDGMIDYKIYKKQ